MSTSRLTQKGAVTTPDIVREQLIHLNRYLHIPWRRIATLEPFCGIPPGTLCTIAKTGYVPKKWHTKLGIRIYKPAPVCVKCGEVHVTKRCTKNDVQPVRRWRDLPPELLRLALEYRG